MMSRIIMVFLAGIIVILAYFVIDISLHLFVEGYGSYHKLTKHVDIYPLKFHNDSINQLINDYKFVSMHELGHYIYFNFSKDQIKKVKELYKKSNYITEYSRTNHKEWFGDYFSFFIIDQDSFMNSKLITKEEKLFFKKTLNS